MSVLESYTINNPFGKSDECAKFTIDDILTPFTLHDITVPDRQYTLGLWLKSDVTGGLVVHNAMLSSDGEWTRHVVTFTAGENDLDFFFTTTGTYYIYHPKLEIGNKATDWTEAPEDVDNRITTEVERRVEESTEAILEVTDEQIKSTVRSIKIGRNFLKGTSDADGWSGHDEFVLEDREFIKRVTVTTESFIYCNNLFDLEADQEYTLSFEAKQTNIGSGGMDFYILPSTYTETGMAYNTTFTDISAEYKRYEHTFKPSETATSLEDCSLRFDHNGSIAEGTESVLYIKNIQLEKGNKATEYAPATEDMAAGHRMVTAETAIAQLKDWIYALIVDENGATMMQGDAENGWRFSMAETKEALSNLNELYEALDTDAIEMTSAISSLTSSMNGVEVTLEWVKLGNWTDPETGETEPCIYLGESDSDYSLVITNTKILFRVGSRAPTRIMTYGLKTKSIEIEEEIRQGGFIQTNTPDGGWALVWKGVS